MKNIIKIVMWLLVVFIGLASFASFGDYINPNLDVTEVRASHILVKTRPEAVKIRKEIVDNKVRDRLIFGDKMPMQYFINYYGLKVSAAFSGCSTDAEPSGKTIAYLINVAKEEKIPVILYIELNTGKVASTIASEVGDECTAMKIQTLHNVEKDDFKNGETWVTLMERNIDVLKKALQ